MPTDEYIAHCVVKLMTLRLANAPATAQEVQGVQEAWREFLEDLTNDEMSAALKSHVKASKFWPTPADLLGHVKPPEKQADPHEVLWDRVMERVRDPRHRNQDGSGKVDFEGVLTPEQQGILRSVGGSTAIRMANDYELTRIRAAFLRALRDKGKTLPALRLVGGE